MTLLKHKTALLQDQKKPSKERAKAPEAMGALKCCIACQLLCASGGMAEEARLSIITGVA